MSDKTLAEDIRKAALALTHAMNAAGCAGLRVSVQLNHATSQSTPDNRGRHVTWYEPTVLVSREEWV